LPNDYLDQVQVGGTTYDLQDTAAQEDLSQLKSHITSKDEEDADYHLGFYIDENGDLCQVDEEE